jgi:hypothetical protein
MRLRTRGARIPVSPGHADNRQCAMPAPGASARSGSGVPCPRAPVAPLIGLANTYAFKWLLCRRLPRLNCQQRLERGSRTGIPRSSPPPHTHTHTHTHARARASIAPLCVCCAISPDGRHAPGVVDLNKAVWVVDCVGHGSWPSSCKVGLGVGRSCRGVGACFRGCDAMWF